MTQKGTHTWNIIIHYHRCPSCGKIIESRDDYVYEAGKQHKDLVCPRCLRGFTAVKRAPLRFGPLLGQEEHVEWDWRK